MWGFPALLISCPNSCQKELFTKGTRRKDLGSFALASVGVCEAFREQNLSGAWLPFHSRAETGTSVNAKGTDTRHMFGYLVLFFI